VTDVVGVPDRTSVSSTVLNYQMSQTILPPTGSVGSWEGEIHVTAEPTIFASVATRDAGNDHADLLFHFNTALGTDVQGAVDGWAGAGLERWRLAYYGVTVYLDAPATASQGSIVAAQYSVRPLLHSVASFDNAGARMLSRDLVVEYQPSDTPVYETLHQQANSYAGLALDGCYMPLKLDGDLGAWHDMRDLVMDGSGWAAQAGAETIEIPTDAGLCTGLYAGYARGFFDPGDGAPGEFAGGRHFLPLQANLGTIAFRGLSLNASVRVVYRVGVEAMAQPGTQFAPFMKAAPGYDAVAVDTYFRIARELKDAYPAEYNSLGTLWNVIKSVASKVAPVVLPMMGPFAGPVKLAANAVGGLVDKALEKRESRKSASPAPAPPKQLMSATELERSRAAAKRLIGSRSRVAVGRKR
jgi:hypothetical protein